MIDFIAPIVLVSTISTQNKTLPVLSHTHWSTPISGPHVSTPHFSRHFTFVVLYLYLLDPHVYTCLVPHAFSYSNSQIMTLTRRSEFDEYEDTKSSIDGIEYSFELTLPLAMRNARSAEK